MESPPPPTCKKTKTNTTNTNDPVVMVMEEVSLFIIGICLVCLLEPNSKERVFKESVNFCCFCPFMYLAGWGSRNSQFIDAIRQFGLEIPCSFRAGDKNVQMLAHGGRRTTTKENR